MTIRNLMQYLLLSVCTCGLNAQNLITNPGFEANNSQGKIANWHPCDTTIAGIETSNVYAGNQCAKFVNNSGNNCLSYYYANYSDDGATQNYPTVESDAIYEFSVKYKTDTTFSGNGIYLQICFYKGAELKPIGMYQSPPYKSSTWSTLKLNGIARKGADKILVGVYYDGQGAAWVDEALLVKTNQLCRNGSFEIDAASPADKPDYWLPRGGTYTQYHHVDTSFLNTYLGDNAVLFNSPTSNICYFYGPYDAAGAVSQYIPVCPGDSYAISCFGRTDSSFSGNGIKLCILFWNNTTFVSRADSLDKKSTFWNKITQEATVPANANFMSYSVEYNGQNKAWIDEVRLNPKNLVKNSSFETDASTPADKPDYWWPRGGTYTQYHHVETTLAYEGSKCGQFNNTGASDTPCYFYGPASADSTAIQYMDVNPGESYSLSAWRKVDPAFTGTGLSVSMLFYNGDGSTFISRVYSTWNNSTSWSKMSVTATVPAGANKMTYSMEYNGKNKAWVDRAELYKTSPWYYTEAPTDSLENLSFTPPAKKTFTQMSDKVISYHNYFESNYMAQGNPAGTWGLGYGAQSGNHPLVRCSANAALAYLHAYGKIDVLHQDIFEERAKAALDWLLTQQNSDINSPQYGAFPFWSTTIPTYTGGGEMYEGGLAGLALIKGYTFFNDIRYLEASNRLCDYFRTIDGSVNANYNAFATMALAANYTITDNENYLNKALYFMDTTTSFQLDSGMWADDHNQYIYYHGIITRSLVQLMNALPDSNPKKEVIRQALYKALNHIRRSQNHAVNPPLGTIVCHPLKTEPDDYCPFSMTAASEAYALLGMTSLSDSLNTMSAGALIMGGEIVQGHYFAAIGILFDSYY